MSLQFIFSRLYGLHKESEKWFWRLIKYSIFPHPFTKVYIQNIQQEYQHTCGCIPLYESSGQFKTPSQKLSPKIAL